MNVTARRYAYAKLVQNCVAILETKNIVLLREYILSTNLTYILFK